MRYWHSFTKNWRDGNKRSASGFCFVPWSLELGNIMVGMGLGRQDWSQKMSVCKNWHSPPTLHSVGRHLSCSSGPGGRNWPKGYPHSNTVGSWWSMGWNSALPAGSTGSVLNSGNKAPCKPAAQLKTKRTTTTNKKQKTSTWQKSAKNKGLSLEALLHPDGSSASSGAGIEDASLEKFKSLKQNPQ